jgi:hypothetical protein
MLSVCVCVCYCPAVGYSLCVRIAQCTNAHQRPRMHTHTLTHSLTLTPVHKLHTYPLTHSTHQNEDQRHPSSVRSDLARVLLSGAAVRDHSTPPPSLLVECLAGRSSRCDVRRACCALSRHSCAWCSSSCSCPCTCSYSCACVTYAWDASSRYACAVCCCQQRLQEMAYHRRAE